MADTTTSPVEPPLPADTVLRPGFIVAAHLSRSRYLDIYEVWSEDRDCFCVAKVLRPDRRDDPRHRRDLIREGRLLKRLTHMHLVRAYEVHTAPQPAIILESIVGPTLARYLAERAQPLPFRRVSSIGVGIVTATRYLHRQGILHLDLNPDNIILQGPIAKVIDLSAARKPGRGRPHWGTDEYMAPEQVLGGIFTTATDVWGIGAILFELATRRQAFPWDTTTARHAQLDRRAQRLATLRRVSAPLAAMVDACLHPDPAHRPETEEIVRVLQQLTTP